MSTPIEATLRLDIAQYQAALARARGEVRRLREDAAKGGSISEAIFGKGLAGMTGKIAGLGAAVGLGALVKRGMEFNQTMNDSTIAIANVTKKFQGLSDAAAQREAEKAMKAIVAMDPRSSASITQLTQGFLATYAAAQSAGVAMEDNIELVGMFSNAMANANIPAEQLVQEMRSIMTGNITSDSALAKMLQINNSDIEKAKAAGKLFEFLRDQVAELGTAGDTAGVAFSTLESAIDKVAGALTKGMFGEAIDGAKQLAIELENNKSLFEDIGVGIRETIRFGAGFLGFMNNVRKATAAGVAKAAGGAIGMDTKGHEGFMDTFVSLEKDRTDTQAKKDAPKVLSETNGTGKKFESKAGQEKMQRELADVERERIALAERQFKVMLEHMTPAKAIEAVQKRINTELEKTQHIKETMTDAEQVKEAEKMFELQNLLRDQRQRQSEELKKITAASKEAAENAKREADEAQRKSTALSDQMLELEILRQTASGHERKAKALQEQLDIQQMARQIQERTGLSEAEALKVAKETARLKKEVAESGGKADGSGERERKKIRGFSSETQGGVSEARDRAQERVDKSRTRSDKAVKDSFGTMDEFKEWKKKPLRDSFKFPGLEAMDAQKGKGKKDEFDLANQVKATKNPVDSQSKQPETQTPVTDPVVSQIGQTVTQILTALS